MLAAAVVALSAGGVLPVWPGLVHLVAPLGAVVDLGFDSDAPAAYEPLGNTDAPAEIYGTPLPEGTRSLSVTPAGDLPLMPSGWRMDVGRNACPLREPHPYLPPSGGYYEEVNRFLDGDRRSRARSFATGERR
ncbi:MULTISPECIES: hypothetical protein [unclassified Nocardiopsis]|uniref:hypothetical protein n=1 Tax=unclassified Nocardiopsis TaxID=2649073 RepID=UPI00135B178F|nr:MULTISPECIES: hypothetical protein [unclassified Nocardiopsis]